MEFKKKLTSRWIVGVVTAAGEEDDDDDVDWSIIIDKQSILIRNYMEDCL